MIKKVLAAFSIIGLAALFIVAACAPPQIQLNITSDPISADVYIDKAKVGMTPLRYNVVFAKTPQGGWERKVIEVRKECFVSQYLFLKIDDSPNVNLILIPDKADPKCTKAPEPPPPPPAPPAPPPTPPAPPPAPPRTP